jgi:hypothetical protein
VRAESAAFKSGLPLAPAGMVLGLVLAAVWGGLTLPGWYRRRHRANGE